MRKDTNSAGAWLLASESRLVYDRMLVLQERDASGNVLVTYTRGLDLSERSRVPGALGPACQE